MSLVSFSPLLQGLFVGMSIASVPGLMTMLCMRTATLYGFTAGVCCSFGIALADLIYALLAGLSVRKAANFLNQYETILVVIGTVLLISLGIKAWTSKPKTSMDESSATPKTYLQQMITPFILNFCNPVAFALFLGLSTSLLASDANALKTENSTILFAAGISLGSFLWWIIINIGVRYFHKLFWRLFHSPLFIHCYASGLIGFGTYSLVKHFMKIL